MAAIATLLNLKKLIADKIGRAVVEKDLKYETEKYPQGYQSTLTLNCFMGVQFVGEVKPTPTAAAAQAAEQAIATLQDPSIVMGGDGAEALEEAADGQDDSDDDSEDEAASSSQVRPTGAFQNMLMKCSQNKAGGPMLVNRKGVAVGGKSGPAEIKFVQEEVSEEMQQDMSLFAVELGVSGQLEEDSKVCLERFCSKFSEHVVTAKDLKYETIKYDGGWQSTVTLACFADDDKNDIQFTGEISTESAKGAEMNAARQLMQAFIEDQDTLPAFVRQPEKPDGPVERPSKKARWRHRKSAENAQAREAALHSAMTGEPLLKKPRTGGNWIPTDGEPKSALAQFVMRKIRSTITRHAIHYATESQGKNSYTCTLTLNCLGGLQFASNEVSASPKDAERLVAKQAIDHFREEIDEMNSTAKVNKQKGSRQGPYVPGKGLAVLDQEQLELMEFEPDRDVLHDPDPKGLLNKWLQKQIGHCVNKMDVVYESREMEDGYQSTVTLNCMDGIRFVGPIAQNTKEAERMAAKQVILHYREQIQASEMMPHRTGRNKPKKKKKGATDASAIGNYHVGFEYGLKDIGGGQGLGRNGVPLAPNTLHTHCPKAMEVYKGELNNLMMKILKKSAINKGDTLYEVGVVEGGFQSIVKLKGMAPSPHTGKPEFYAGDVTPDARRAEQSAAGAAIEALRRNPLYASMCGAPKLQKMFERDNGNTRGLAKAILQKYNATMCADGNVADY